MNVLLDRHHADLYYSMQRLFEDRLGHQVYAPTGHEWWDAGYWQFGAVFGDDRLARQYLVPNGREVEPGLFLSFDSCHPERPVWSVTLERARAMDWGAAIASVDENQQGYARFARERDARYLYSIGNTRQDTNWSLKPLILSSSEAKFPKGQGVWLSQEFDSDTTFRWREPAGLRRITSFVNLLSLIPESQIFFDALRVELPDWEFRSFGHSNPDGFLTPVAAIAEEMARSAWAFHDKPTGDGFGHIIHNWAAVGRPLIGHASYYSGQMAEALWIDGETCIDLDRHPIREVAAMIADMPPERYRQMCEAIRDRFERDYDPSADAYAVATLLA